MPDLERRLLPNRVSLSGTTAQGGCAAILGLPFLAMGSFIAASALGFLDSPDESFHAPRSFVAVIGVMVTLVCCSTPWDPDTDGNAVACRSSYNFRPGTREFDQCMQRFKEIDARKEKRSLR